MNSYQQIYQRLLKAAIANKVDDETQKLLQEKNSSQEDLDTLLHPQKHAAVVALSDCCACPSDEPCKCEVSCLFSAIKRNSQGKLQILAENCVGCGECIENCKAGKLVERKDIIPLFEALNTQEIPVYAMIAPAFIGQFHSGVTVGKLRSALKKLGFYGMLEVAFFADILTLKEALEFDRIIHDVDDFLLTSCCCPIWVAMIRKVYSSMVSHIPPSVSPMVACGRSIKKIHPDAKTVFIGPCVAKKAEAREKDIADAVDFVLTFKEVEDILSIAHIDPADEEEDPRDHSSMTGRIYARTAGVSAAVEKTLTRIKPDRSIPLRAQQANGIPECKALLQKIMSGRTDANFLEGMGCVGGCVGGPRVVLPPSEGTAYVNSYAQEAKYETPVDNPFVLELMQKLGFHSLESLLEKDNMFNRDFSK